MLRIKNASIIRYDVLQSTQVESLNLIQNGLDEPFIVLADSQLAGVGTSNKKWVSYPGDLTCTINTPCDAPLMRLSQLSLVVALALHKCISRKCSGSVHIKWPNDILLDSRKCAGILITSVPVSPRSSCATRWVSIGVGVNLAPRRSTMLESNVNSLDKYALDSFSKVELLSDLLQKIEEHYSIWLTHGIEYLIPLITPLLYKDMCVYRAGTQECVEGCLISISERGARIKTQSGENIKLI